jgi:hypothetical protein
LSGLGLGARSSGFLMRGPGAPRGGGCRRRGRGSGMGGSSLAIAIGAMVSAAGGDLPRRAFLLRAATNGPTGRSAGWLSRSVVPSEGPAPRHARRVLDPANSTLCRFESRRPPLVLGAPARKRMAGEVEHAKGSSTGGTGCEATRRLSTVTTPGERTRGVRARPFPTSIDLTERYAVGYVNDQRAHRCAAAAGPDTT